MWPDGGFHLESAPQILRNRSRFGRRLDDNEGFFLTHKYFVLQVEFGNCDLLVREFGNLAHALGLSPQCW